MSDTISNHNGDLNANAVESALNAELARLDDSIPANRVSVNVVVGSSRVVDDEGTLGIVQEPSRVDITVADAPPIEPPPIDPPPIDPPPIDPPAPGERATIHIDPVFGIGVGDDANNGLTPQKPVATNERSKVVAFDLRKPDPSVPLTFNFRSGDEHAIFGDLSGTRADGGDGVRISGYEDAHTIFTGYGNGPRPLFNQPGGSTFRSVDDGKMDYTDFIGLRFDGVGTAIGVRAGGKYATIGGCDFHNANIDIQANKIDALEYLTVRDSAIWNCLAQGGHRSGSFLKRVKFLAWENVTSYRNGWNGTIDTPDDELGGDVHNHGAYHKETCTGARYTNSAFVFNAGAGLQARAGGDMSDVWITDNGRTGCDWGLVNGSPTTQDGVEGVVTRVFLTDDGAAQGFGASNVKQGHIHGCWFIHRNVGWNAPLQLRADHGVNNWGPHPRVGLNNLIVENNYIDGNLLLTGDGWQNVVIRNNHITGQIVRDASFADPSGGLTIVNEAGQTGRPVDTSIVVPDRSTYIEQLLRREIDATYLINQATRAA